MENNPAPCRRRAINRLRMTPAQVNTETVAELPMVVKIQTTDKKDTHSEHYCAKHKMRFASRNELFIHYRTHRKKK